jgi:hypothetical protein
MGNIWETLHKGYLRENERKITSTFKQKVFRIILLIFFGILLLGTGVGVSITIEWRYTFGGVNNDGAFSVIQTADGGFLIAGSTESYDVGSGDIWLVKTDASCTPEWNKIYGGTLSDYTKSIIRTTDGGFAIAGLTESYGTGGYNFWLIKTDVDGLPEWNRTFSAPGSEWDPSVIQTSDGGFVLAGFVYATNEGDLWFIKTDPTGHAVWNHTFGGVADERALAVIQTSEGGFALAGYTRSFGAGLEDMWLVKTDSNGFPEWNTTYGGLDFDDASSVIQTSDGGFLLAGATKSYGAGEYDFWLVKTDSTGQLDWNKTFGGINDDSAKSMVQTQDGGFILAGYTRSYGAGATDVWLVKTNFTGHLEWNKTFGGIDDEAAFSVIQAADGDYVLTGITESYGAGAIDMWLIKTSGPGDTAITTAPLTTSTTSTTSSTSTTSRTTSTTIPSTISTPSWDFYFVLITLGLIYAGSSKKKR